MVSQITTKLEQALASLLDWPKATALTGVLCTFLNTNESGDAAACIFVWDDEKYCLCFDTAVGESSHGPFGGIKASIGKFMGLLATPNRPTKEDNALFPFRMLDKTASFASRSVCATQVMGFKMELFETAS